MISIEDFSELSEEIKKTAQLTDTIFFLLAIDQEGVLRLFYCSTSNKKVLKKEINLLCNRINNNEESLYANPVSVITKNSRGMN